MVLIEVHKLFVLIFILQICIKFDVVIHEKMSFGMLVGT